MKTEYIMELLRITEAQAAETEVKAKADQAVIWCQNASDYTAKVGGKPWKYLLIPHDVVAPNVTMDVLIAKFEQGDVPL